MSINDWATTGRRLFSRRSASASRCEFFPGCNVSDQPERWKRNYRCPDVAVFLPGNPAEDRGTHWYGGPDFAAEVHSRFDRSRKKFGFYAKVGVRELLLVDRHPWVAGTPPESWTAIGCSSASPTSKPRIAPRECCAASDVPARPGRTTRPQIESCRRRPETMARLTARTKRTTTQPVMTRSCPLADPTFHASIAFSRRLGVPGPAPRLHAASPSLAAIRPSAASAGPRSTSHSPAARLGDAKEIIYYQPGITTVSIKKRRRQQRQGQAQDRRRTARSACTTCGSERRPASASCGPSASGPSRRSTRSSPTTTSPSPQPIAMNVTVNGVADNEDVDYFVVEAKKGERITAEVEGMRLGITLFDPYVAIMDAKRFELAPATTRR